MSSTSELAGFAARLRESILSSAWVARPASSALPTASEPDFDALALQLFALQFQINPAYRRLCEARGARPATVAHWTEIPAAPTSAFKELELSCLPAKDRTTVFHSSGTTGQQPSRHFHNASSLALYEASLLRWFEAQFPARSPDGEPGAAKAARPSAFAIGDWQLAILTPPPAEAPHSSLVHMFDTIQRELGRGASSFVGRAAADGAWGLELEAALEALQRASDAGQRLLLLGTAFSFVHLLDGLAEQDLCFELPPGSRALETGGYKGRSRSMPKPALHALIFGRLGIALGQIVCEYGMSELSSQAYDSALAPRPFRFPPWARAQIVSPETGCEVAEGATGLVRVFDLANAYSVMAIQTEDLGVRHGDAFALAGRAALAESRGCSLMAV